VSAASAASFRASCVIVAALVAMTATAQNSLGLQRGMLLEEAITELERDGLTVFYSSDLIKPWSRVNVVPSAAEPEGALQEILAPLGLTTQPGPGGAFLVVRDQSTAEALPQTGGIAGIVRQTADGTLLPGVSVRLPGANLRTMTERDGRFAFHGLTEGSYRVAVLYPVNGFEVVEEVNVTAEETTLTYIDVDTSSATALEEVVVAASQYELTRAPGASQALLTGEDIEYLPDFGDDALRAVARLPGTATNGVSAQSNVRGGEVGETLVRFDGLRLYNPYHLKNFHSIFSTVDPRLVSSIDVYTGGFPATFGDRMSSVIDIASLSPPEDRYHEIAFSFFNTSALTAGRFDEDKGEWLASIRRSNLDVLFDSRSSHLGQPRYMDAFTKLAYDVNSRLRVTANYLYFADEITLADADGSRSARADDDEHYLWLRLDHDVTPALSGTTLVAKSQLEKSRSGFVDEPGVSVGTLSEIRDIAITTLQSDWIWQFSDRVLLRFGGDINRSNAHYDYRDQASFDVLFADVDAPTMTARQRTVLADPSGHHYGLYASLRYSPTPRLATDFGLRWDKQTLDPSHSSTMSPRIGLRYRLGERTFLRGSVGRFYQSQAINELQVEDGVDRFFEPQQSDHFVIGVEHAFPEGLSVRIEAYDKRMRRLRPRFENLLNTLALLPELKPDRIRIAPSEARARGLEILLSQQLSYPLTWWLGYSRARVTDTVAGQQRFRSWDQTHALSAGLNWDTPKWNVGLGVIARSGWPTTAVTLDESGPTPVAVPGVRNSERIGAYRSTDLRLTRKFKFENGSLDLFVEVNNLLGRKNPCCLEYEIREADEGGGLEQKTLDYLPRIPSIGFIWRF